MTLTKRLTAFLLALVLLLPLGMPVRAAGSDTDKLIRDLINYYHHYQEDARTDIDMILAEMQESDPALADTWGIIMDFWIWMNRDMEIQSHVLPDGLPEDDSLCITVMGYQLMPDGDIRSELRDRLEVTLASAQKYPNAYILVTGGPTASQNKKVSEASQMAKWLVGKGISQDRIIVENKARSTIENAIYGCKLLYRDYPQVKTMAVITSDYHIRRSCLYMSTQAALDAYDLQEEPIRVVANATCRVEPNYPKDLDTQVEGMGILTDLEVLHLSAPVLTRLESLSVSGATTYDFGADLDLSVVLQYSNGHTVDVTQDVILSGFDFGKAGMQTVTVTYEEHGATISATVDVEILPPDTPVVQPTEESPAPMPTEPAYVETPADAPSSVSIALGILYVLICLLMVLILVKRRRRRRHRRPRPAMKWD